MPAKPLSELVAPDWAEALDPVAPVIAELGDFLRGDRRRPTLSAGWGARAARVHPPMADVRVLIVGRDPIRHPDTRSG